MEFSLIHIKAAPGGFAIIFDFLKSSAVASGAKRAVTFGNGAKRVLLVRLYYLLHRHRDYGSFFNFLEAEILP